MNVTGTTTKSILANVALHPTLEEYLVPYKRYLEKLTKSHEGVPFKWLAVGVIVFDHDGRVLLIQRAATDSMPNKWEIPGGGCDEDDPSIIHSALRELEEEAGLKAISVGEQIGKDYVFLTSTGNLVNKLNFMVEVENGKQLDRDDDGRIKVRLDPNEHQAYVWASQEEVQDSMVSKQKISFTSQQQQDVILEACQRRKQLKAAISEKERV